MMFVAPLPKSGFRLTSHSVGPIVASVIYIGGGSLTRTLTKSRGYQEVSSGPTDAV